jgi:hypothetical protein
LERLSFFACKKDKSEKPGPEVWLAQQGSTSRERPKENK